MKLHMLICFIWERYGGKLFSEINLLLLLSLLNRERRGRDSVVVGFTTTCAISSSPYWSCEFKSRSWRSVLDTTVCDKVCQWLTTGRWFSLNTLLSFTKATDHHDITEILLKVTLNTKILTIILNRKQNSKNIKMIFWSKDK